MRPVPRTFWPLVLYCVVIVAGIVGMVGRGGPHRAEPQFQLNSLVTQLRIAEGAQFMLPEGAEASAVSEEDAATLRATLAELAQEAVPIAQEPENPPLVREQAAAIWLIYVKGGDEEEPVDARVQQLLPDEEARSPLGVLVARGAAGAPVEGEELAELRDVEMSAWLKSRLGAWVESPAGPIDPDGLHARAEQPFLQRAFLLLSGYTVLFMVGVGLFFVMMFRWRKLPGQGLRAEHETPWAPEPWVAWYVVAAWFAFTSTLQLGLGAAAVAFPSLEAAGSYLGLGSQLAGGLFALWMMGNHSAASGGRSTAGTLLDLRVGLQPFQGRAIPPLLWGMAGFAVAVPFVYGTFLLQQALDIGGDMVSNPVLPELVAPTSTVSHIVLLVSIVAAAPVFEEIVFRGFLFRQLRVRLGAPLAVVMSAGLFALVHFDAGTFLPLFVLGCALALVTERSGGLMPAILVHAFWNGGTVLLATTLHGG